MPQGLTRWGSCNWATPGRSDTRLVCRTLADRRARSSSGSSSSRDRVGFRTDVPLRRRLPASNFETKPRPVMRNLQVVEENRLAAPRAGFGARVWQEPCPEVESEAVRARKGAK